MAQLPALTEEDVAKMQERAEQAEFEGLTSDPSLTDEGIIVGSGAAKGIGGPMARVAQAAAAAAAAFDPSAESARADTGYSGETVLKDVQYLRALDEVGDLRESLYIGDPGEELNTANRLIYVKMYRMPSFYAKMVSGRRTESGQYILTLLLPQSQGEAQKTVDVVYARSGVSATSGYAHATWTNPVNDDTIFASLKDVPDYDAARNNAYLNAYKLAPFASFEDIVKSGNAIPAGSALATKTIQELWPVHEEQGMKVSLFEGEEAGIVRNVVYFSDHTSQTFDLDYAGTHQLAASYTMKDSGVLYQPDFWVLGEGAQPGIERIASFIRSKTWNGWLATLSKRTTIHRSVRDHFDVDMHENAEQVAANLVSNIDQWTATASGVMAWNSVIEKAEQAMPETGYFDMENLAPQRKMFNLLFLYTY